MNDAFLRACKGYKVRPVPIWLMRQAGRYLPEYQQIRGEVDFLTLCKTPELAAEVTLQPVDILGVDAAILFSDILIPAEAMGLELKFIEGQGPILSPTIRDKEGVSSLKTIDPKKDVPFVLDTIKILREKLKDKVPLIGFSGAPFTLATYMIEGGSTKSFFHTKRFMYENPKVFKELMNKLCSTTLSYLSAQIEAGVQAVQMFDTWAGILHQDEYQSFVLPFVQRIFDYLKSCGVPRIYFALDSYHLFDVMSQIDCEVFGIDWRVNLDKAVEVLGEEIVVQGNLDPCALFLEDKELEKKVRNILIAGNKAKSHIFNLGHGVLPNIPAERVKFLVDLVHKISMDL